VEFFLSWFLHGRVSLVGKKGSSSALLIETGSVASGRKENLGIFLRTTSCLAV